MTDDRIPTKTGPAEIVTNGPQEICPICEAERRKQRRRKTLRPNRILSEHPDHGGTS